MRELYAHAQSERDIEMRMAASLLAHISIQLISPKTNLPTNPNTQLHATRLTRVCGTNRRRRYSKESQGGVQGTQRRFTDFGFGAALVAFSELCIVCDYCNIVHQSYVHIEIEHTIEPRGTEMRNTQSAETNAHLRIRVPF